MSSPLEDEFFRVEGGENPDGVPARRYVRDLRLAPNGDLISPRERAALEHMAHFSVAGETHPSIGALAIHLDTTTPEVRNTLLSLVFKGILRPRMLWAEWQSTTQHVYTFAELPERESKRA